jgi:LPXTG-motif cell wall-anchored protein
VLGRYTFSMVDGVTQGFEVPTLAGPAPALASTGSPAPNFVVIASALTVVVAGIALVGFRRRRAA